jgi:hypothetical protein
MGKTKALIGVFVIAQRESSLYSSRKCHMTPEDLQESFATAENVRCTPATSEDFSIPTDIVFTDQCEMLKNSMKALESMKGQLPAGMNIPGY